MDEVEDPKPGEAELEQLVITMPDAIRQRYFRSGEIDVVGLCMWIWRDGSRVGWNAEATTTMRGGNPIVPRMLRDHMIKQERL